MIRRGRRDRRGFVYLSDGEESRRWPAMVIVGDPTEGGHARKLFRRWNQTGPRCPFEGKNMQEWSRHFGSESGEERPKRHRSPGTLGTLPSTWKVNPRELSTHASDKSLIQPEGARVGVVVVVEITCFWGAWPQEASGNWSRRRQTQHFGAGAWMSHPFQPPSPIRHHDQARPRLVAVLRFFTRRQPSIERIALS